MFSTTVRNAVLDHLFGLAAWTAPTELWIGLSTADPLADGSGLAEPAGNNYSRVELGITGTNWLRTANVVDNKLVITFPEASGAWGTITHLALFDAVAGTYLLSFALTAPKDVDAGDTPRFPVGDINTNLV